MRSEACLSPCPHSVPNSQVRTNGRIRSEAPPLPKRQGLQELFDSRRCFLESIGSPGPFVISLCPCTGSQLAMLRVTVPREIQSSPELLAQAPVLAKRLIHLCASPVPMSP